MIASSNVAVIIPARGGSKGIPRKNLRPLAGKPLIWYAIQAARAADPDWTVAVSTEDDEIALMAERFGATVVLRPAELSGDDVTLDPVICDAIQHLEGLRGRRFDVIATVQPTSPLIRPDQIREGVAMLAGGDLDTVLSAVDDRHLRWRVDDSGRPVPDYAARLNRQKLPAQFRETGSLIACRRGQLDSGTRIGRRIDLLEVSPESAVDIDSFSDLAVCEHLLRRRTIVFVVAGNSTIGLGHAYRALVIANELVQHHVEFLCPAGNELAAKVIADRFYPVKVVEAETLVEELRKRRPHLIVNDVLDTAADLVQQQRQLGARVVNFEDLGPGTAHADLVINALYPHASGAANVLSGPRYFELRDEFVHVNGVGPRLDGNRTLLATFGGVDEGNLTCRIIRLWPRIAGSEGWQLAVVLGPGYGHVEALERLNADRGTTNLSIVPATARISDYMLKASAAVTSGGRTVLELAALGVPTVVVCQNEREMTHSFAAAGNGVLNLGHRDVVSDDRLVETLGRLMRDDAMRRSMAASMQASGLRNGKARVIEALSRFL